jgi:hypothetical protein
MKENLRLSSNEKIRIDGINMSKEITNTSDMNSTIEINVTNEVYETKAFIGVN